MSQASQAVSNAGHVGCLPATRQAALRCTCLTYFDIGSQFRFYTAQVTLGLVECLTQGF